MSHLIKKILLKQKGTFALVERAHCRAMLPIVIHEIEQDRDIRIAHIDCRRNTPNDPTELVEDLGKRIENEAAIAAESGSTCVCCFLLSFDSLPSSSQCRLIEISRRLRESSERLAVQVVAHGPWNRYSFKECWDIEFHQASHGLDRGNIHTSDGLKLEDIIVDLTDENWLPSPLTPLDRIAAEAMLEFTGGDEILIRQVLDVLRSDGHSLRAFQETQDDVTDSESVFNNLALRFGNLGSEAVEMLHSILESQVLVIKRNDRFAEDLRLLGFIKVQRVIDCYVAYVASPLMDRVLRRHWKRLNNEGLGVYVGNDLVFPLQSINKQAYEFVLVIEGLLRNWLVSTLSKSGTVEWTSALDGINVPGNPGQIALDNIQEDSRKLFLAAHPDIDPEILIPRTSDIDEKAEGKNLRQDSGRKKESVVESSSDWRRRHLSHPSVKLASAGLPAFFTTGALSSIYTARKAVEVCRSVESIFPSKEELTTVLEQFSSVRSAVAHNQVLAFSVLEVLEKMNHDLCARFGRQ